MSFQTINLTDRKSTCLHSDISIYRFLQNIVTWPDLLMRKKSKLWPLCKIELQLWPLCKIELKLWPLSKIELKLWSLSAPEFHATDIPLDSHSTRQSFLSKESSASIKPRTDRLKIWDSSSMVVVPCIIFVQHKYDGKSNKNVDLERKKMSR